ncbi:3-hydroxyacyl-CoA dehydrogenase NAD-binding domain-containing protein, partial [Octadecabacter sp.]|nr:3-hydroxyacyl-CoA dehydrogenase NAD-binding domain-containing protein [Octadecabacter sp.]
MGIERIGVVGAGQMGNGIAHVCALAGYEVLMTDISEDALVAALASVGKNMDRQVSKGLISEDEKAEGLRRIGTT